MLISGENRLTIITKTVQKKKTVKVTKETITTCVAYFSFLKFAKLGLNLYTLPDALLSVCSNNLLG